MKILTRGNFMKMPEGTIFAKGNPWYFDDLSIKAQSIDEDFVCMSLVDIGADDSGEWFSRLNEMLETGASYPFVNDNYGRDGCFDEEEIFLVFERDDLMKLRDLIDGAIAVFDDQQQAVVAE